MINPACFGKDLPLSEIRARIAAGEKCRWVPEEISGIKNKVTQRHLFLGTNQLGVGSYSSIFDAIERGEMVEIEDKEMDITFYELVE